jgi:hypothetical protein
MCKCSLLCAGKDYIPVCTVIPFTKRIPKIKLEKDLKFVIEEGLPTTRDHTMGLIK